MVYRLYLAFLFSLILTVSSCTTGGSAVKTGVVNSSEVQTYISPDTNSKKSETMYLNQIVEIEDTVITTDKKTVRWYKLKSPYNNDFIYIKSDYVTSQPAGGYKVRYTYYMTKPREGQKSNILIKYRNREITVIDENSGKIIKEILTGRKFSYIDSSIHDNNLFIAAWEQNDDYSEHQLIYSVLLNTEDGSMMVFNPEEINELNIDFHSFYGDKKYAVLEFGTAAESSGLFVYDFGSGKVIYGNNFIPADNLRYKDDSLLFYQDDYECKKNIPEPKVATSAWHIKRLVKWKNGKSVIIKDCIPNY